jgi:hypothetical protein
MVCAGVVEELQQTEPTLSKGREGKEEQLDGAKKTHFGDRDDRGEPGS